MMYGYRRFFAIVRLRAQLLWRHGFITATGISGLVWMLVLNGLPVATQQWLAPVVIFSDIAMVGFYVIGGLSMMERSDGTAWALHTTPLRFVESLFASIIVLSLLAVALCAMLLLVIPRPMVSLTQICVATVGMAVLSMIYGYAVALPYRDFSTFLIPSQLYAVVLFAPLLTLIWPHTIHEWWWWCLPTFAAWHLLIVPSSFGIGWLVALLSWGLVLGWWAHRRYHAMIRQGGA